MPRSTISIDFNLPVKGNRCLCEKWAILRLLEAQKLANYDFTHRVVNVVREIENYSINIFEYKLTTPEGDFGRTQDTCTYLPFLRRPPTSCRERHLGQLLELFGFELKYVSGVANL